MEKISTRLKKLLEDEMKISKLQLTGSKFFVKRYGFEISNFSTDGFVIIASITEL